MFWARRLLLLLIVGYILNAEGQLYSAPPFKGSDTIVSRIPREAVGSTALATVGYSKRRQILEVEFLNGAIYRYFDVPRSIYNKLMAAESKARYYDANIRYKFRSVRIRESNPKDSSH